MVMVRSRWTALALRRSMSTWQLTGAAEGMVADFTRSIEDQRWRVWTCCREDPSGTGREKMARTLDECLSRALSTGAGALWWLLAVGTGAYGTNTISAGTGGEGTSTIAAWTSGVAKSSRSPGGQCRMLARGIGPSRDGHLVQQGRERGRCCMW